MRSIIPASHISSCGNHYNSVTAVESLNTAISKREPITDEFYDSHYQYVSCVSKELDLLNINTRTAYADRIKKHDWKYDNNRVIKHNQIIEEYVTSWKNIPHNKQGIITGGLIGAGKTSTIRNHSNIDIKDYALLSADMMKIHFAEHGLVPKLEGFIPLEASILTYKETNHVTWRLFEIAIESGVNIIFDTMMGQKEATLGKIIPMRKTGYSVDGLFVDVTVETALRRMKARHRAGMNNFIVHGRGYGGRLIPEKSILEQVSSSSNSVNRDVFDEITQEGLFSNIQIFDNNVDERKPVRVQ